MGQNFDDYPDFQQKLEMRRHMKNTVAQAYHEMRLTIFGKNFERHLFVLNSTQNDVRWGALVEKRSNGNFKD